MKLTTRTRTTCISALALLAGLMLAAGCSGGSAPASTAPGQPSKPAGASSNQSNAAEFGLAEEDVVRRVDAIESLVTDCMAGAGFEYVAVDFATIRTAMDSNSKPSGLSNDEFRTQFGYGITTLFAGAGSQAALGTGEQNTRIREGLTAADRVAYDRALYGDNPNATLVTALDQEDFSQTGGCTREAVQQVFSPAELRSGFVNYQNADAARVDEDTRVIAAYREWATCMRQAGYSYGDSAAIAIDLTTQLEAIAGGADPATLPAAAQTALADLQAEERAIAAADRDCEIKFVDAIKTKVETELFGLNANP